MSRLVLLVVVSAVAGGLVAAPVPAVPEAKALVVKLSDPSERVRDEVTAVLKDRPDALPWLRRAARLSDKDTARRATALLAASEKKWQEAVTKAIDACIREGRIDLLMEWHHYWQPENKDDLWPVGERAAKPGLELFAKSCSQEAVKRLDDFITPPRKKVHFHDGSQARLQGTGTWYIRTDRLDRWPAYVASASVAVPTQLGAGRTGGRFLVLGSVQVHILRAAFIACDGDVWRGSDESGLPMGVQAVGSVIVCRGNFRGTFTSGVLLVDGDVDLTESHIETRDSLIRASGEIRLPKDKEVVTC